MCNIRSLKIVLLLFLFPVIFIACQKNVPVSSETAFLDKARSVIGQDPQLALRYLDSISDLENLNMDDFMRYTVAHVEAKQKCRMDISDEVLIFQAKKYFEKKGDDKMVGLAAFYAGDVYYFKKNEGKAMVCFWEAAYYAQKAKDTLLMGKSQNNIGNLYYEQNSADSAVVHFRKALALYDKTRIPIESRLRTIRFLSQSYYLTPEKDSAFFYNKMGLTLADSAKNNFYQTRFSQLLGLGYLDRKEFDLARKYLIQALAVNTTPTDSIYMSLGVAYLYSDLNQKDSLRYYLKLAEKNLPLIKDDYIVKDVSEALSDFYKQTNNYPEALLYANKAIAADKSIEKNNKQAEILQASNNFQLYQKDQQISTLIPRSVFLWVFFGLIFITVLLFINDCRHSSRENEAGKELEGKLSKIKTEYEDLNYNIYKGFEVQLTDLERNTFDLQHRHEPNKSRLKSLISYLAEKNAKESFDWAKDVVMDYPLGKKIVEQLAPDELYLLALSIRNYTESEISLLLKDSIETVALHKSQLRETLRRAGFSEEAISEMF